MVSPQVQIPSLEIKEAGTVREVKHGIVKAGGLPSCVYGQVVEFGDGLNGMVIEFTPAEVLIIVFGDERRIAVGQTLTSQSQLLSVPVGEGFIGRMVDCLGQPLDGKGPIAADEEALVFRQAAGVMEREPITEPLLTGTKILDVMIPIGKGQRELIIGDRQTGKTSILVDAILNQKGKEVLCLYCWVGGSHAAWRNVAQALADQDAWAYTIGVCAFADSSPAEQYLCAYTAATLGESFMRRGRDVLVVFDDLTKHAWAYRQLSLLMERPPGREAYPGDIFYIHSQLMERAGRLRSELGGGTMTFLPVAETLQGDITGYIPSNLISMTDGQVYLNTPLFHEGFKPAIDLGLSVSRIGMKAQGPAMRGLSSGLRLVWAEYREMLRMTKLRTRLSEEAMEQLRRGEALRTLLTQEPAHPVSLAEAIVVLYAFKRKILEILPSEDLARFKGEFFPFLCRRAQDLVNQIERDQELTPPIKEALDREFVEFFRRIKEAP